MKTPGSIRGAVRPYDRSVRLPLLLVAIALIGCDRYDDSGVFVSAPCAEQSVEQLHPAHDPDHLDDDTWIGDLIWVDLECPAPGATLALNGPNGGVAGSTFIQHGGRQILFEPAAFLQPDAYYAAHLETGDGVRDWEFGTSSLGAPIQVGLTERALALHPAQGALLDPPGFLDDLLPALQAGLHPVIQFLGEPSGGLVPLRLGGRLDARATAQQDLVDRTWDLNAAWTDPVWAIGPIDMTWELFDFALVLEGAVLEGAVASDLGSGGGGRLEALWDTRPADDALGTGPGSLCARAQAASDVGCTDCADGVAACLPLSVRSIPGDAWSGVLQVVDPG